MKTSLKILSASLAALAIGLPAKAGIIQYTITVEVSEPYAGVFVPWSFSGPGTFTGTFDADDTVAGSISNLALTVGGIDIGTTFNGTLLWNQFDPSLNNIDFTAYNIFGTTIFNLGGNPNFPGAPENYAVAVEGIPLGPQDPYNVFFHQNWVGTYSIAPSAVPEPSVLLGFLTAGSLGLLFLRRRR